MTPDETLDRAIDALLAGSADGVPNEARALARAVQAIPPSPHRADIRRSVLTTSLARRPSRRLRWVLAGTFAALFAFGGVAVAASKALPGSPLYGLRRGFQAVRVAVAVGNRPHVVALLDRAQRDLVDATTLIAHKNLTDATGALDEFDGDIATARSAIGSLETPNKAGFTARADALAARAARLRERITELSAPTPAVEPSESEHPDDHGKPPVEPSNKGRGHDESESPEPRPTKSHDDGKNEGDHRDGGESKSPNPRPTSTDSGEDHSGPGGGGDDGGSGHGDGDGPGTQLLF